MKVSANDIIPDKMMMSNLERGQDLYTARHILDKFLGKFGHSGEINRDCLYEILRMDLDQAREFLKDHSHANNARYLLNPRLYAKAEHVFATMRMMLQAYLNEEIVYAA